MLLIKNQQGLPDRAQRRRPCCIEKGSGPEVRGPEEARADKGARAEKGQSFILVGEAWVLSPGPDILLKLSWSLVEATRSLPDLLLLLQPLPKITQQEKQEGGPGTDPVPCPQPPTHPLT